MRPTVDLRLAADHAHAEAQFNYGRQRLKGEGIAADQRLMTDRLCTGSDAQMSQSAVADSWTRAADQGSMEA
jgi:TPR repeat protein